ncbi:MAG: aminomethyltransferase family protein [Planctomycetes bacterium]|nr:aminomethyltransferase family protein [Planctomycetota bacterium]
MTTQFKPIARGPLTEMHRRGGATLEQREGWWLAVRYPREPGNLGNALIDFAHRSTWELNGPDVGSKLVEFCGVDVPVRQIHSEQDWHVYRLTPRRALIFGKMPRPIADASDVSGGWATLAVLGPDSERLLSKVTAVDLRPRTLPPGGCCQGPIFGVNTLFGRFARRFELHVAGDSAEFLWSVLLDAGAEFQLQPAGVDYAARHFV